MGPTTIGTLMITGGVLGLAIWYPSRTGMLFWFAVLLFGGAAIVAPRIELEPPLPHGKTPLGQLCRRIGDDLASHASVLSNREFHLLRDEVVRDFRFSAKFADSAAHACVATPERCQKALWSLDTRSPTFVSDAEAIAEAFRSQSGCFVPLIKKH